MSLLRFAEIEDAALIDRIARDPSMDEFVKVPRDWSAVKALQQGAWLVYDEGMFLVEPAPGARVEVHACILPEGRGPQALEHARTVCSLCFCVLDIEAIECRPLLANKAARVFARAAGFDLAYVKDGRWVGELTRERWEHDPAFHGKDLVNACRTYP